MIDYIRSCAQLAAVLEVSGWPKPGNVHRTKDLPGTRYEHFLAGSIAMGSAIERAARQGIRLSKGAIDVSNLGIGNTVKQAVSDVKRWHSGGNTHLGVCLLFVPLATAAAKTYMKYERIHPPSLRRNVEEIMRSTTSKDAVDVYEAITMVSSMQELGRIEGMQAPDLYDAKAKRKLITEKISLFEAMKTSSTWDTIAREWVSGMEISFGMGYPTLMEIFQRTNDINVATVHTFLKLLSEFPDTFIARKVGLKETANVREAVEIGRRKTKWISETADAILKMGGLTTEGGRAALQKFDRRLHSAGGELNPGTSADLTAASLMIALLCGLRF